MNAESAPASRKKIPVVEDNEVILKTISLKLQGAGFKIITALDGSEAVAAARRETPDLILLDINFPPAVDGVSGDGFRIMDWFHRLDPAKKIPIIIIITGLEDMKNKERATSSGAVAFFHKPINHDDLLKVIRTTLGGSDKPA
jgi:CheY-like chemotaxis protein